MHQCDSDFAIGWLISRNNNQSSGQHYAYVSFVIRNYGCYLSWLIQTVPPVTIAMILVAVWTKTDDMIKRLQVLVYSLQWFIAND